MSVNRHHHRSIVSAPESQTSCISSTNHHRNYNQPLINSAVTSGSMSDEEIARQQQERLYFESLMDVDPPATTAATLDVKRLEDIDTDAAIARQLQEEEYSRNSLVPSNSNQRQSNNNKSLPIGIDPYSEQILSDAEIAAQLQAEEDQRQGRHRPRHAVPQPPRRPTNQTEEVEVIPFPLRPVQPQQPSSGRDNNRNTHNIASLFRHLADHSRRSPGASRRGAQNLERTTGDFGPNDYENLLELDKSVEKKPLTDDEINRLPVEKFQRRGNQPDENNKCNICWDEFEQNQSLRRLRCLHIYHKDCIDPWLKTSNLCPICRMGTN